MQHKILFVCLGNICRSPVAEGIMLDLVNKYQLPVLVDSAGTGDYHIGEAPDNRTIKNAKKNGVDLSPLRARQFEPEDFEKFDHIYVMDRKNHANVVAMTNNSIHKNKVELFLNTMEPGSDREVPDPYFGGEEGFEEVFRLLYKACDELCLKLKKTKPGFFIPSRHIYL